MSGNVKHLETLPSPVKLEKLGILLKNTLHVINAFAETDVTKLIDNFHFDQMHPDSAPGDEDGVLIFSREGVKIGEDSDVDVREVVKMLALAIEELEAGAGPFDAWLPWKKHLRKLTGQEYMTLVVHRGWIYPGFDWRGVEKLSPKLIAQVVEMIHTGRDVVADLPRRSCTLPEEHPYRPTYLP